MINFGKHTYHKPNITLHTFGAVGYCVEVGNFTSISSGCNILLSRGHHWPETGINFSRWHLYHSESGIFKNVSNYDQPSGCGNVKIGSDVWIGHGVTIMPGVSIGDGAIVATNSHVIKNIEPYAVYGGNPAKFIKYRFSKEIIDSFLELKWWDLPDNTINEILPLLQQEPTIEIINEIKRTVSCQNL